MPVRVQKKLMKTTWYPQPHTILGSCAFECDDETLNSTIVPFCFYDEGLGNPELKETNPRNANFAVLTEEANCFVGSRINNIFSEFTFALSSFALDQNLPSIALAYMPIYFAFIQDYTAIDELTSTEVQDVIEMQTETTDRQGGPLYVAATDLPAKAAGPEVLGLNTPFLDTDTGIEAVAFNEELFYDAMQFLTIGPKLAAVTGGLHWINLSANRPIIKRRFNMIPKVKRMNEFTYAGLLLHVPTAGGQNQNFAAAEIAGGQNLIYANWNIRYSEWNEDFNSRML